MKFTPSAIYDMAWISDWFCPLHARAWNERAPMKVCYKISCNSSSLAPDRFVRFDYRKNNLVFRNIIPQI